MTLLLPTPANYYDVADERERNRLLEEADGENVKRNRSTAFPDDVFIGAEIRDNGGAVINAMHPSFGVVGDGTTDDSSAIQAAINAASAGDTVLIPQGTYAIASTLTLSTDDVRFVCEGKLDVRGNGDLDYAMLISGDRVRARVRIDHTNASSHSGRGESVRVTGTDVRIDGHIIGERAASFTPTTVSNCVFVAATATHCTIGDMLIEQAGYASVRQNGAKHMRIENLRTIDYLFKGYVYNSDVGSLGSLSVDYFYGESDTTEAASNSFLVDPDGQTKRMAYLHIDTMVLRGNARSSCPKIEYVDHLTIDTLDVECPESEDGFILSAIYETCHIGKVKLITTHTALEFAMRVNNTVSADVVIDNLYIESGATNLRFDGTGTLDIKYAELVGAEDQAIRWGANEGGRLVVRYLRQDSDSSSEPAITVFSGPNDMTPGDLILVQREVVTGTADWSSVANTNRAIQRSLGEPREFRATQDPSTASDTRAYLRGDIVWTTTPSVGGVLGWVCVSAGSPGTWSPISYVGPCANGTATLANGNTSVAVTHGLGVTPDIQDISVTPIEAWGSMTQFWINTPTSTQFTINVDQDPGQDVDFAWTASVQ